MGEDKNSIHVKFMESKTRFRQMWFRREDGRPVAFDISDREWQRIVEESRITIENQQNTKPASPFISLQNGAE